MTPLARAFAPSRGREVVFGRRTPRLYPHALRFEDYLLGARALPEEPTILDYTGTAGGEALTAALADIEGNDVEGDCVEAWLCHQESLWTGNAGAPVFHATREQVTAMYSSITGYVPGDPSTDRGTDMSEACNWICANGYPGGGDRPAGWLTIDGSDPKRLRQAIWLFGGNGFGVGLPDPWVQNMPSTSGFVWDAVGPSNPNNGHCFLGAGYNGDGVIIDTWGLIGLITWKAVGALAVAQSGGEIKLVLSHAQIAAASQKAPSGFDWLTLVADFDSIGGSVPQPAPVPIPVPSPAGPVSLAQAQAMLAAGMASAWPLMTRPQAIAAAQAAVAARWPTS